MNYCFNCYKMTNDFNIKLFFNHTINKNCVRSICKNCKNIKIIYEFM